jgi:isoquinoline 1-oxidoreductase beta subunit
MRALTQIELKQAELKQDRVMSSRRQFLIGAAVAGAGLTIGLRASVAAETAGQETAATTSPAAPAAAVNPIDIYLHIAPDNTVTVLSSQMDGGQGSYTGLATLVAEELDADWTQMRVEGAAGNPKLYGNPAWGGTAQGTGGSTSIAGSWDRYRYAGATARAMLVAAAAKEWGVPATEIRVEKGVLSHASGKSTSFGALADKAATVPQPVDITLKAPSAWTLIGNEKLHRLDNLTKTTGRHQFPIDVRLPGMLTAVMEHPPLFGAHAKSYDATAAKQVKGVIEVVETPRGVAVVATDTWAAIKGRQALKVQWDETGAESRGSDALMAQYKNLAKSAKAAVARREGDTTGAFAKATKVIEAEFEFPYLAHAAMEPLDAAAKFENGVLEIWAGHQLPDLYQQVAAKIMGIDPAAVKLHVMTPGGFFGRRATPDADVIVEVVSVLKATGARAPVRVQWTREDDMRGGRYRPMYHHTIRAGLDRADNLVAWQHRIIGQSILKGTPFEAMLVKDGIDDTSVEGAATLPYAIPNMLVDLVTTDVGVPVLWWRSVGSTHTAYSTEVFLDEIAYAAGKDPVAFRRTLLKDQPRHLGVLNLAAEKAGWDRPAPEGRFRGIAVHKSFGTYVAQVAEISLKPNVGLKVERVVCAVDCGIPVNPNVIRAQIEGGVGYGLGAILKGEITLDGGRVVQGNFDDYPVLTIDEMAVVEVHIVPSAERPTGVGEPGVPPIGPAVANAVFAATGKRIRVLPFSRNELRTA